MSLGARASQAGFSQIFENVAADVLAKGTLIVAAAGNDSDRPSSIRPVSHPANCPSIMAVGAVDNMGKVARFSNRGIYAPYGNVDIAGPGVGVFSSTKRPELYATWNGTSMATPHVAGIAALYAQQSKRNRGFALWKKLLSTAKPLQEPTVDVGAGLVQAPLVPAFIPFPPKHVTADSSQSDHKVKESV
jgi:subtilisin family serine protease